MSIKGLLRNTQDWIGFQQQYEAEHMGYSNEGDELAMRSIDKLVNQAVLFGLRALARQPLIATLHY